MSRSVHGVWIVTTDGPGGRAGITVSSLVSASLEPPLVLLCIRRRTPALAAIIRNRAFCANLLAAHHRGLADVFAGRPADGAPHDFERAKWSAGGVTGSPALSDAVASLECDLFRMGRAGTHQVVLGRCVGVREAGGPTLFYTERRYGSALVGSPESAATIDHDLHRGEDVA